MEHPIINDYFASRYATPYKYGEPVLVGSGITGNFDQNAVDSPFVFFHNEVYQMLYIGFDGVGYQTALSQSTDLLHWTPKGVILSRDDQNRWDSINISGNWILKETNDLNRLPTLKKVDGKYWMSYHAYPMSGYESGAGSIGLAWCEDEDLMEWHRMEAPILTVDDPDAQEWEKGGLYKSCLIYHDGLFYLFYNAKNNTYDAWREQIGFATSKDLVNWKRNSGNPVICVTDKHWDSLFCSDPFVVHDNDHWLMFYFGFNGQCAQEGLAASNDLLSWKKYDKPILTNGKDGEIDAYFAHKPSIIRRDGILYHFYCASRAYAQGDQTCNFGREFRTISVATSKPVK